MVELGRELSPKTQEVFDLVKSGLPREGIIAQLSPKMPRREVLARMSDLRSRGRLPKLTPKEVQKRRKEGGKLNRRVFGAVEPYALMGMRPLEIKIALELEGEDNRYSYRQILNSYNKAVDRGLVKKEKEGDQLDARKIVQSKVLMEQLNRRVLNWLKVSKILKDEKLPFPKTRIEWGTAIDMLENNADLFIDAWKEWLKNGIKADKFLKMLIKNHLWDGEIGSADQEAIDSFFKDRQDLPVYQKVLGIFLRLKRESMLTGDLSQLYEFADLGEKIDFEWFNSGLFLADRRAVMELLPKKMNANKVNFYGLDDIAYEEGRKFDDSF